MKNTNRKLIATFLLSGILLVGCGKAEESTPNTEVDTSDVTAQESKPETQEKAKLTESYAIKDVSNVTQDTDQSYPPLGVAINYLYEKPEFKTVADGLATIVHDGYLKLSIPLTTSGDAQMPLEGEFYRQRIVSMDSVPDMPTMDSYPELNLSVEPDQSITQVFIMSKDNELLTNDYGVVLAQDENGKAIINPEIKNPEVNLKSRRMHIVHESEENIAIVIFGANVIGPETGGILRIYDDSTRTDEEIEEISKFNDKSIEIALEPFLSDEAQELFEKGL